MIGQLIYQRKNKHRPKNLQILYKPKFRKVEEHLENLGYDEDQFKINRMMID